uniref:Uncharacterized protein n=1 Tax=Timema douglasi TaxID=61478 RepID=A0A7R8VP64_TIMDO|nr:unnamed protein product [Timema douglasi]
MTPAMEIMDVLWMSTLVLLSHGASLKGLEQLNIYDQRQNGTYNVQFHLKDVEILAIVGGQMDEESSYNDEYNYDYHDPVEPSAPTIEPEVVLANLTNLSTTEEPSTNNLTQSSNTSHDVGNSTNCKDTEKENPANGSANSHNIYLMQKPTASSNASNSNSALEKSSEDSTAYNPSGNPSAHAHNVRRKKRRCSPGFLRDNDGGCRKASGRPLVQLPFGLRLAPFNAGRRRPTAQDT